MLSSILNKRLSNKFDTKWSQPKVFNLAIKKDQAKLDKLVQDGKVLFVHDSIDAISRELSEYREFSMQDGLTSGKEIGNLLNENDHESGRWVLFPWSHELVRFPEPEVYKGLRTFRFRDLISREEQDNLGSVSVAVFGMSVGSSLATGLVRNGIGQRIVIGDISPPKISNIGRTEMDIRDLSNSKVDAVAKMISHIDPFVEQVHFLEGFNESIYDDLRNLNLSLVVDEMDDMKSSALLRIFAAKESLPYISVADVHDTVVLEVCRHDIEKSPLYAGDVDDEAADNLSHNLLSIEEVQNIFAGSVGYVNLSPRLIESGSKVGVTIAGIPQLGSTAFASAGVGVAACRDVILGKPLPSGIYAIPVSQSLV